MNLDKSASAQGSRLPIHTARRRRVTRPLTLDGRCMRLRDVGNVLAGAIALATMGGCYFANQPKLERTIHARMVVGMPLATAISNASAMRFNCGRTSPVDCTRLRQSLMPYSCVERVRLYSSGTPPVIDAIEIPKIACAGL